jgi:hypothetical protein
MTLSMPHCSSRRLALAVGVVLAGFATSASAAQWRYDNGVQLIWNTRVSVGANWRAGNPSNELYSRVSGQLLGLKDGLGGSNTDSATLNYGEGDRFSTPLKLITDLELRKGDFGGLVRVKAWYDQSLEDEKVRFGHQNNDFNGGRGGLNSRPPLLPYNPCPRARHLADGEAQRRRFRGPAEVQRGLPARRLRLRQLPGWRQRPAVAARPAGRQLG